MLHNIFTISLYTLFLQYKFILYTHKHWQILYTFAKFVQYLPFFFQMCIIFATFCVSKI